MDENKISDKIFENLDDQSHISFPITAKIVTMSGLRINIRFYKKIFNSQKWLEKVFLNYEQLWLFK